MFLRAVPGQGWCGIMGMAYTWDLFCDMKRSGYNGRYTYLTKFAAVAALREWNGEGFPPGEWVHHHGGDGYYGNPNNPEFVNWVDEMKRDMGHEIVIDWRSAWKFFEVGYTPLQYYFEVWMFENAIGKGCGALLYDNLCDFGTDPEITDYLNEESRVLWSIRKYYFKQCSKLRFKEIIL